MILEGVKYDINWRAFRKGKSMFFPCLDTDKALATVHGVCKRMRIQILTKVVIVDGIRGLRIWRQ